MKLVTATEDDAIVVAYQIKADMLMKIPNNKAAREAAIVACEWIEDSWKEMVVRILQPLLNAGAK